MTMRVVRAGLRAGLRAGIRAALSAAGLPLAAAAPAEVIDFADLTPQCRDPFVFDDQTGACKGDAAKLGEIKTEAACKGPGLKWTGTACTAPAALAKEFPNPECGNRLPNLACNAKAKNCRVVRETPRSAMGDFVGDCFKIAAVPSPNTVPFAAGDHIEVMSQRALPGDKSITSGGLAIGPYFRRRWGQPGSAVTFAVAAT